MNFLEKVIRKLFPFLYKKQQEQLALLKELKKQNETLSTRLAMLENRQRDMSTAVYRSIKEAQSIVLRHQNLLAGDVSAGWNPGCSEKEIDILGAIPSNSEARRVNGDYYFALALQKAFSQQGIKANVLPEDDWGAKSSAKYVLVLRGWRPYYLSGEPGKRYMLWNISHPDNVEYSEYNLYDYVFWGSKRYCQKMRERVSPPTDYLYQCTDPEVMGVTETKENGPDLLFIGNSRGVYRKILDDLLPTEHKLAVYGSGWELFPVQPYVVAEFLENEKIGQAYHDAKIVLNDHWDDMRENGFVNNRIYDALAAGAFVISDYLPEIEELFGDAVVTYKTREELHEKVDYYLAHPEERRQLAEKGRRIVLEKHTFAERVKKIRSVMERL